LQISLSISCSISLQISLLIRLLIDAGGLQIGAGGAAVSGRCGSS
jgi:hypothetical protein